MAIISKTRRLSWEKEREKKKGSWGNANPLYYTSQWKEIRKMCLERQPFCVECLKEKRYNLSRVADHIISIENGGDMTSLDNLQGLCHSCHNRKSSYEAKNNINKKKVIKNNINNIAI